VAATILALPSMAPGHELAETRDLIVSDAGEDVRKPGLGVHAVELSGLDQWIAAR
jgi:hypothetical protein